MKERGKSDWVIDIVIYLILLLIGLITLYPFWNITAIAFNNALDTLRGGIYLWPRQFTLENFKTIFNMPQLGIGFYNSILRTVVGSTVSVGSISMLAFVISRKGFVFGKFLQILFVITMYVNGGLIPTYFVMKGLGLRNNFLVYIIPMMIQPFYLFIAKSYMKGISESLLESARIDGANDFVLLRKIILPLSRPIIATLFLFTAVDQWNAWFDTFIYISNKNLTTMQYELVKLLSSSTASIKNYEDLRGQLTTSSSVVTTPESIRMAITVVATVPIIIVYPFVQKYFVQGLTMGAVKE